MYAVRLPLDMTISETQAQLEAIQHNLDVLVREIQQVIVGQDEVLRSILTCLLAGGHGLLEGVPGLGKTLMIRTLASAVDLSFARVQFTPDLMPADIVGSEILDTNPDGTRSFRFFPFPLLLPFPLFLLFLQPGRFDLRVRLGGFGASIGLGWVRLAGGRNELLTRLENRTVQLRLSLRTKGLIGDRWSGFFRHRTCNRLGGCRPLPGNHAGSEIAPFLPGDSYLDILRGGTRLVIHHHRKHDGCRKSERCGSDKASAGTLFKVDLGIVFRHLAAIPITGLSGRQAHLPRSGMSQRLQFYHPRPPDRLRPRTH